MTQQISDGMKREIKTAKRRGLQIRKFNDNLVEVNSGTDESAQHPF
jgi:hypothetical protein